MVPVHVCLCTNIHAFFMYLSCSNVKLMPARVCACIMHVQCCAVSATLTLSSAAR